MLRSPAMRVLSLSARRLLDRLEIELAAHAGGENGQLPLTYADLEEHGLDRHAIAPAIREAVALGFVEVTVRGRAGNAEFRAPSKYRLTYLGLTTRVQPTNGSELRRSTRLSLWRPLPVRDPPKRKIPVGKATGFGAKPPTENLDVPPGKSPLQGRLINPHYCLYLRWGRHRRLLRRCTPRNEANANSVRLRASKKLMSGQKRRPRASIPIKIFSARRFRGISKA